MASTDFGGFFKSTRPQLLSVSRKKKKFTANRAAYLHAFEIRERTFVTFFGINVSRRMTRLALLLYFVFGRRIKAGYSDDENKKRTGGCLTKRVYQGTSAVLNSVSLVALVVLKSINQPVVG